MTGAGSGLGKAMSLALAGAGAQVFLVARRRATLDAAAEEIRANGGEAEPWAGDVAHPETPSRAVEACVTRFSAVDILVNNAGIAREGDSLAFSADAWRQTLEVNLSAPFFFSRAAAQFMVKRKQGKIIQVASMFGLSGEPRLAAYCASKGGLIQMTRSLAAEWAKYNIQVNALAPGYFATEMTADGMRDEKTAAAMLRRIPARRFGRPEELAPWVVLLASSASDYMTGEVITIDGGRSAR